MNIRNEQWQGHTIRFVEKESGEWWAVLADIARALKLRTDKLSVRLDKAHLSKVRLPTNGGEQVMLITNEYGVYEAVFESRKKVARDFKRWVYGILKTLRYASGLEEYQVLEMTDAQHQ